LDDPAWIEIDHETDPAPMLGEMFDGQTQATWASWSKREPLSGAWEEFFGQRVAECFVVDAKVLDINARLRHTRAAARFKRVDRPVRVTFRHPAAHWTTAQPLVLKKSETRQIFIRLNLFTRVPRKVFGVVQPERTARFRIEMPRHNFANPSVQFFSIFSHR